MKLMDFLDIKSDGWLVKYFNKAKEEYTPSLQDNITAIKFSKSDVESMSMYQVFTDSESPTMIADLTIDNIKSCCIKTLDCDKCKLRPFCRENFMTSPDMWKY